MKVNKKLKSITLDLEDDEKDTPEMPVEDEIGGYHDEEEDTSDEGACITDLGKEVPSDKEPPLKKKRSMNMLSSMLAGRISKKGK